MSTSTDLLSTDLMSTDLMSTDQIMIARCLAINLHLIHKYSKGLYVLLMEPKLKELQEILNFVNRSNTGQVLILAIVLS